MTMTDDKAHTAYNLAAEGVEDGISNMKDAANQATQHEVFEAVPGVKQGHKCCGGCCDVRRATIVVNIVFASLTALGLVALGAILGVAKTSGNVQYDDDEVAEAMAEFEEISMSPGNVIISMVFSVVQLLLALLGIYGAIKYNYRMVAASGIMYVLYALTSLPTFNLAGILMGSLFAYPHYFLVQEIRQGIMTPTNYQMNEKHSCCCV